MELYKELKDCNYILKITGNSQFMVLNKFELGIIDKKYIKFNKIQNCLMLEVYLNNNNNVHKQLINGSKKKYISFEYSMGKPKIKNIWDCNEFISSYIIYPITDVKKETYDIFNMQPLYVNENEQDEINDWGITICNKPCKICPKTQSIISRYGKLIKINDIKINDINDIKINDDVDNVDDETFSEFENESDDY